MKKTTIEIKEKTTGRVVRVEGDLYAGMRACINRNTNLKNSRMGGEWAVNFEMHIGPSEYKSYLKKAGELEKPQPAVIPQPEITYKTIRTATLTTGEVVEVGSNDPYLSHWAEINGERKFPVNDRSFFPHIVSFQ